MSEGPKITSASSVPLAGKQRICFGIYEVDLGAGELRKSGMKIKLHRQPFAVLAMLLERPGEVVTREELQQKLWASDTFVDFEHGLNKAVNKVREALGDDADNPRYIETLPRRGYRFVGPIAPPIGATIAVAENNKEAFPPNPSGRKRWAAGVGLAGLCVLLVVGIYWIRSSTRLPRVLGYRQLTTSLHLRSGDACGLVVSHLATDGFRVFFSEPGFPVSQVAAGGGEIVRILSPFSCFVFSDISPDRSELLGSSSPSSWTVLDQPLWGLSVASGQAHRLGNLIGHAGAWSPDGQRIAYATGNDSSGPNDVYVASKDGSETRELVRFEKGSVSSIRWSPDGSVLRMIIWEGSDSLWEVSAAGANPHRITLFPAATNKVQEQSWTPDGKYSVFTVPRPGLGGTDIWVRREMQSGFVGSTAKPVQLTTGAMSFWYPTPSPDGKKIFAIGGQSRGELVQYDLRLQRIEPFLSGISAEHLDFSRDGKWVTYVTFPEGILWRSKVDGSDRMQLTTPPLQVALPRWSPDGTRIAFAGYLQEGYWKIYVVSAEGSKPDVVSEERGDVVDPTWTADGNSLTFGGFGNESAPKISSVDLHTGRVSMIPGSQGLYSPRVSPDGRFIVALDTPGNRKLMLFDQQTRKWTDLLDGKIISPGWPQWSGDGRYVYVRGTTPGKDDTHGLSLYRVGIANHNLERVAAVEIPEGTTGLWGWMGVTPDGSPLLLRDLSIQEIYALDVDLP
jgi:Tol biopolymer transport system component/DNA-binding winged helix-turn-helix (wHTH) protein